MKVVQDDSEEVKKMLQEIPLNHIVLETDAPYLIRYPWELGPVIHRIAEVRNLAPLMISEQTKINTMRLFEMN